MLVCGLSTKRKTYCRHQNADAGLYALGQFALPGLRLCHNQETYKHPEAVSFFTRATIMKKL